MHVCGKSEIGFIELNIVAAVSVAAESKDDFHFFLLEFGYYVGILA